MHHVACCGGGTQRIVPTVITGQDGAGLLGGPSQLVSESKTRFLGGQLSVLARHGRDPGHLVEAELEQVGFSGSVQSRCRHRNQLTLNRGQLGEQPGVLAREECQVGTCESIQSLALRSGLQQPVLIRLAVYGDQRGGDFRQDRDRHRGAAGERARAAFGGHCARQHYPVFLDDTACMRDRVGKLRQVSEPGDALHPGLRGAAADCAGISSAPEQQP